MTHRIFIIDPKTDEPCAMLTQSFKTHAKAELAMDFMVESDEYGWNCEPWRNWSVQQEGTAAFNRMKARLDQAVVS